MKFTKMFLMLFLCSGLILSLGACEGDTGPAGPQGPPGEQGPPGTGSGGSGDGDGMMPGDDDCDMVEGIRVYNGDPGNNVICGDDGPNRINGRDGNDEISGGGGDDVLHGNEGEDEIMGGPGDDVLRGGDHNDRLYGNEGNDDIAGQAGMDKMYGGPGDDVFWSMAASDGSDDFFGGEGKDTINFAFAEMDAIIADTTNNNITGIEIDLGAGYNQFTAPASDPDDDDVDPQPEDTYEGIENVVGSSGIDTITGDDNDNVLSGGSAVDASATGGPAIDAAVDTIKGLGGNDKIDGIGGANVLDGGDGNDTLVVATATSLVDQTPATFSNFENLEVRAGVTASVALTGDAENNVLTGGAGGGAITAGAGDDRLISPRGAGDLLNGEGGNDIYVVTYGQPADVLTLQYNPVPGMEKDQIVLVGVPSDKRTITEIAVVTAPADPAPPTGGASVVTVGGTIVAYLTDDTDVGTVVGLRDKIFMFHQ